MTSELKPCPFCGGGAIITEHQGKFCAECDNSACPPKPVTPMIKTLAEAVNDWNTRAVPDVPELVRYDLDSRSNFDHDGNEYSDPAMTKNNHGEYVRYDQAAAVIAELQQELRVYMNSAEAHMVNYIRSTDRAEAAEAKTDELEAAWLNAEGKISDLEAKLAKIEKQEVFGYVVYYAIKVGIGRVTIRQSKIMDRVSSVSCHREWLQESSKHPDHFVETVKVYTTPVASDVDLRANVLVKAVTKMIEDDERFEGEIPLATIKRVYAAHAAIIAALNPSESRT